jgi:adenosine kinase
MDTESIRLGLAGAKVLIGNDYEFGMMAQKLDISEQELIARAPLTIITRGAQGSTIYTAATNGQGIDIPVAKPHAIEDPTGAGDAYLAGLVFGLAREMPLDVCGRIAALASAFAIEQRGCQEHVYTPDEFVARYTETFGANEWIEQMASAT